MDQWILLHCQNLVPILSKNKKSAHRHFDVLSWSKKLRQNFKKERQLNTVFVKQIILTWPTSYWICITFTLNSSESAWGRWNLFFSIHALLLFSLLAMPCLKTSPALLSPSLFVLSESARLPLEPPLLPCLWCESGRWQRVLTCQLSCLPEGWLWASVC